MAGNHTEGARDQRKSFYISLQQKLKKGSLAMYSPVTSSAPMQQQLFQTH